MVHRVSVGLDSPGLQRTLQSALGQVAELSFATREGRVDSLGRLEQSANGRLLLFLTKPYTGAHSTQVQLSLPTVSVMLEAPVRRWLSADSLLLDAPSWVEWTERRSAKPLSSPLPLRYLPDGSGTWHSGAALAVSKRSLQFMGPVPVHPGMECALRFRLESVPLPLFLRSRCRWSGVEGDQHLMEVVFSGLSFQAEQMLFRHSGPGADAEGG